MDEDDLDDLLRRYQCAHLVTTPLRDALALREKRVAAVECQRIAKAMKATARKLLHADDADAVDGYVAASIIEVARVLEETGKTE